jgi:hypothetical protein
MNRSYFSFNGFKRYGMDAGIDPVFRRTGLELLFPWEKERSFYDKKN